MLRAIRKGLFIGTVLGVAACAPAYGPGPGPGHPAAGQTITVAGCVRSPMRLSRLSPAHSLHCAKSRVRGRRTRSRSSGSAASLRPARPRSSMRKWS